MAQLSKVLKVVCWAGSVLVTLSSTAVEKAIAQCTSPLGNGEGTPP